MNIKKPSLLADIKELPLTDNANWQITKGQIPAERKEQRGHTHLLTVDESRTNCRDDDVTGLVWGRSRTVGLGAGQGNDSEVLRNKKKVV